MAFQCAACEDEWWVCENHPNKAWAPDLQHKHDPDKLCGCGCGIPCLECNDPPTRFYGEKPHHVVICSV